MPKNSLFKMKHIVLMWIMPERKWRKLKHSTTKRFICWTYSYFKASVSETVGVRRRMTPGNIIVFPLTIKMKYNYTVYTVQWGSVSVTEHRAGNMKRSKLLREEKLLNMDEDKDERQWSFSLSRWNTNTCHQKCGLKRILLPHCKTLSVCHSVPGSQTRLCGSKRLWFMHHTHVFV